MKSSTRFFKRKTGTRGTRRGNERLSIETVFPFAGHGTARRVLAALAALALSAAPAGAMVGGATLADGAVARHVVLIVGGHSLCTGVAIAPDLVLTAAHCVLENGKYRLVAFDGRRPSVKDVARVVPHPQFSPRVDAPDLALVKLATPPSPKLIPAAFSDRRAPPSAGERFLVAGFGVATQGERKTAGTLRAATLVATDRPSSQQLSLVDPKKLGESAGLGVCNGDSGGPVFDERDRALVGIVIWTGRTDGEPVCGFVSGAIPLARYRYWILDTAEKLGSPLEP
jgi:secreted trypsin-like serine protease